MSQPVKLSDELVLDARLVGGSVQRSISGQVEFWARLGRAIEPVLRGDQALALCRHGDQRSVSDSLQRIGTPAGQEDLQKALADKPFPHYRPHPDRRGYLIRRHEDGSEDIGRFVNRQFIRDDD